MKNWVSSGDNIIMVTPVAVTAGVPVVLNSGFFGIPASTAVAGATVSFSQFGVFSGMPKTVGQAWTVGQKLYWDPATSKFTNVVGALSLVATATKAAAVADTTGELVLVSGYT